MPMISTSFAIAIGLCLLGIGLMLWSWLNPKWQRADAYDSLIPFSLGVMLLVVAVVVAIVAGAIRTAFGGGV